MEARRGQWGDKAAALVVLGTLALFFVQLELRHPHYFLWDDNASEFLPGFVYTYESLTEHGKLAQVNYHQYLGYTFLASGQVGVLYPPVYLAMGLSEQVLGDFRHGLDVLAILHFLLAGLGMLAVLRQLGMVRWTSAAMAVLWATAPFFVQLGRSWIHVSFTAAWLPWSFFFLLRLLERPSAGRILALAVAKAFFFFQGHPHFFLLVAAGEALFVLARWVGRRNLRRAWQEASALLAAAAGAGCLAAPLILPMWAAMQVSASRARALSFAEFTSNALELGLVFAAQVLHMEPGVVHWATGALFYVGLTHLVALAWLLRRRDGVAAPALLVSVCAFGVATSLWGLFYGVPLLSSLRWPFKSFGVGLFYLFLALAAGYSAMAREGRPWPRRAAAALLLAALLGHGWIVGHGEWDRPLGPNRIDRDVSRVRDEVAAVVPKDQGRVVSMWLSPLEPRLDRFLIFQYATLAGAYHLGGYEPMVAKRNFELARRLEYSNIYRYRLTRRALDDLSLWSVRFLIVPTHGDFERHFREYGELRRVHRDALLEIWENGRALPFAFYSDAPGRPVPIRFDPGGFEVETGGRGGSLTVTVAPLDRYLWSADGQAMGPVSINEQQHLVLEVPPGTRRVDVRYVDLPFRIGISLAAAFLLSALILGVRRRFQNRSAAQALGGA